MNLGELITRHEGKTLEFKRDDTRLDSIARTAVAFANTAGGVIVLGVADRSREIVGVHDPLETEERIANALADTIAPRIVPEIEIVAWRDRSLVAVRVHPGPSRPYRIASEGSRDGVYVRVGSTNRHADEPLIEELARSRTTGTFDEQAVADLDEGALDLDAVRGAFEGVRQIRARDLETLRLVTAHQGARVPTVGGVLLFGRERLERFPDAWIQAARFRGADRRVIVDSLDITAGPVDGIEQALAFIRRNITVSADLEGARRVDVWQYPPAALREAVVNAVVHADYAQRGGPVRIAIYGERIEIENPGLLVPGLSFEDLYAGVSKLRNRVMGRVFRELGLIEQWGSGIGRMIESCRDAGLPDPELAEVGLRFRVTLFSTREGAPRLDELDGRVLEELAGSDAGLSTAELAARIGRTTRATRTRLRSLVDSGAIVELGSGPNDPQRRYLIAEDLARYRTR